jgi:predicted Zn-dependent protease
MDKSDYQLLRWSVEMHIAESIGESNSDGVAVRELTNRVMGEFVKTLAASQVKQSASKRAFFTFRRDRQSITPSWALRKPGTDSRLPRI